MNNEPKDYTREDAFLDAFVSFLRSPAPSCKVLNLHRFGEVLKAKAILEDIIGRDGDDATADIKLFPQFNTVTISVALDDLTIYDLIEFREIITLANNFEVIPLTTGQISCGFAFGQAFISLEQ